MGKKSNPRHKKSAAKDRGGFNPVKKGHVVQSFVRGSKVIKSDRPDPRLVAARRRASASQMKSIPPSHVNPGGAGVGGGSYGIPVKTPAGVTLTDIAGTATDLGSSYYYGGIAGVGQNIVRRGVRAARHAIGAYAN